MSNIISKKLKAIVFTDIVDFTKISASDEEKALKIITFQKQKLQPIVEKNNGTWLKEIGDGLLFSFDSSLEAVNCCIQIQNELKKVSDFAIRIGIHQGDIYVKDGDVYGDDVNIASRVEGFSPPGGITISDKVYKDIQSVNSISTSFIGHKPLKGVSQETKVRCITSDNLPRTKDNYFPKIIGFSNMYFGSILLIIFTIIGILGSLNPDSVNVNTNLDESKIFYIFIITAINLGLVLLLFGYSTYSFYRGVSIRSQKLTFYTSILYFLGMVYYFSDNLLPIEYSNESIPYFITLTMSVIANIILFSFPLVIYKLIKVGMSKIIKKFT